MVPHLGGRTGVIRWCGLEPDWTLSSRRLGCIIKQGQKQERSLCAGRGMKIS